MQRVAPNVLNIQIFVMLIKHSLVERVSDWSYSTFHRLVTNGTYSSDWAGIGKESGLFYED